MPAHLAFSVISEHAPVPVLRVSPVISERALVPVPRGGVALVDVLLLPATVGAIERDSTLVTRSPGVSGFGATRRPDVGSSSMDLRSGALAARPSSNAAPMAAM